MKCSVLFAVAVFAFSTRSITAQEAPQTKLKPADAVMTLPFNSAGYVRELSDSRVIFMMMDSLKSYQDPTKQYMVVADMKSRRMDRLPEWPLADLRALAADTSLLPVGGGWVFTNGTKVLGMLEATNPVVVAAQSLIGADSMGFLVALRNQRRDSADVVRVNRSTAEVEQLVRIKRSPILPPGPAPMYNGVQERVVYTFDGWLGVLRTAPYRVDWRSPAGKWTLGKPIPVPIVRFDDRERQAYIAVRPVLLGEFAPTSPPKTWPEFVEHSTGSPTPIPTPDGKMLVSRTPTADFPGTRYDVVNREGVVERQIVIGEREEIIGFGAKSVYVRFGRRDRTDVRLERHPWP
ncbi:MAG: hypothetical protein ABJB74_10790 [Gemmatimonas sp.]